MTTIDWADFVYQSSLRQHGRIATLRAAITGESVQSGPQLEAWQRARNDAKGWRLRNIASISRKHGIDRTVLNDAWNRGQREAAS